jgi:hypothetical protein
MTVADSFAAWKPSVAAAVLLLARDLAPGLTTGWSVESMLAATGATRSQAYQMRPRVLAACRDVEQPAGRPARGVDADVVLATACRVRDFLADYPGVVTGGGPRRQYGDAFCRFVVGLAAPDGPAAALTVEQLVQATGVPLGTLKDWRRLPSPTPVAAAPDAAPAGRPAEPEELAGHPQVATLLHAWRSWQGDFVAFCAHVRDHLRLPWGRTFISRLLEAAGVRRAKRRGLPRPTWDRGTFRRLFPGAQWLGDGTTLAIRVRDRWHFFNLQAALDVDSDAVVGIHVSDCEDQHAVRQSFEHGEATTGGGPEGMSLDGKACNHPESLADALQPTVVVPTTPARGQAKAPLEGFFGLFSQTAPPLIVDGKSDHELARSFLALLMLVWCWARNGKPRRHLAGRSPAEHYQTATPNDEQRRAARDWMAQLRRRYDRFVQTRRRRADPARRDLLHDALAHLGVDDPDDRLAWDLARYSIDAIVYGIAVVAAKQATGTMAAIAYPDRYLAAVIRNRNDSDEIEHMADQLLQLRLRHGDLCLAPLQTNLDCLQANTPAADLPARLLDLALDAQRLVDFRFYLRNTLHAIESLDADQARLLYPHLVRRVAVSHRVERSRRQQIVAALARAVASLAA